MTNLTSNWNIQIVRIMSAAISNKDFLTALESKFDKFGWRPSNNSKGVLVRSKLQLKKRFVKQNATSTAFTQKELGKLACFKRHQPCFQQFANEALQHQSDAGNTEQSFLS